MSNDDPRFTLLPVPVPPDRSLVERPQLLGLYPTLSWWTWIRIAKAGWIAGPVAATLVAAGLALTPGPIWALAWMLMVPVASLGITERILRVIVRRRSRTNQKITAR